MEIKVRSLSIVVALFSLPLCILMDEYISLSHAEDNLGEQLFIDNISMHFLYGRTHCNQFFGDEAELCSSRYKNRSTLGLSRPSLSVMHSSMSGVCCRSHRNQTWLCARKRQSTTSAFSSTMNELQNCAQNIEARLKHMQDAGSQTRSIFHRSSRQQHFCESGSSHATAHAEFLRRRSRDGYV